MAFDFNGKRVLVTGASRGIGRAIALAFAQANAQVGVNYLPGAEGEADYASMVLALKRWQSQQSSPQHGELMGLAADMRDREQVFGMVSEFGDQIDSDKQAEGIDVLVNNAGISRPTPFLDISPENWRDTFASNVESTFHVCQAVIPRMQRKASGQGVIINILSELGYLGRERFAAYTSSKGALITLTRSLAREFAPAIRVNGIAPGPVLTDLLRSELKTQADWDNEQDIPLKRIAEPEEIASSALFLASEHARFYCGDILSPNGGSLMR